MLFTEQESLPEIWQSLKHELHRGALDSRHPFRYVQLASQGLVGPEIRTVVIRAIHENLNLDVFTDFRSEKVAQLTQNPVSGLHFYHENKRVQIRIQAKAEIHYQDLVSESYWEKITGEAKNAYSSILAPGTFISAPSEGFDWSQNHENHFFAVLRFVPESIEVLQLNGLRHLRIRYTEKNQQWAGQWLVP